MTSRLTSSTARTRKPRRPIHWFRQRGLVGAPRCVRGGSACVTEHGGERLDEREARRPALALEPLERRGEACDCARRRRRRRAPPARGAQSRGASARSPPARRRDRGAPSPAVRSASVAAGRAPAARRARPRRRAAVRPSGRSARSPCPRRTRARNGDRPGRPRGRAASATTSTQPAIPVDDGIRRPTRPCSASPATAANTSSSVASS